MMQPPMGFPNMSMMTPFPMNKMALAPALYIGDLDETIQEESLYDLFSKYGAIHFVRIMRDNTTGKSRGYGFVNFINPRDAENAKQYAQYEKLGKKQIRIMFKRAVKDLSTDANLFVKNIDTNVTVRDLHNHFMNSGNVICCKVATDSEGKSLGYGYVQFERPEDAEKALEALQNSTLKEKEINLTRFVPKDKRDSATAKTNIYLKNLPSDRKPEDLEKVIRQVITKNVPEGKIKTMLIKKHEKENKYCAFICFEEQTSAQQAFNVFKNDPKIIDPNQELYVNWHQTRRERERELKREHAHATNQTNLYIKNLRLDVTEDEVKKAFQNFGKVTSVAVKEWSSGAVPKQSKFGFVAFDNADDAKRAHAEGLNVQDIRSLYLQGATPYINLHQPKDKRQEFLLSMKRRRMQNGMNPMDMYRMPMPFNSYPRRFQPPQNFFPGGPMGGKPMQRGGMNRGGNKQGGNWSKTPQQGNFNNNQGNQNNSYGQNRQFNNQNQRQGPQSGHNANQKPNPNINKNTQQQQQQQRPGQQLQQQKQAPVQSAVTVQSLRAKLNEFLVLEEDKQRQILGELLFPLIRGRAPDEYAPKITGMLIDLSVLEVTEILEFLEDPALLKERVDEALQLLMENDQPQQ